MLAESNLDRVLYIRFWLKHPAMLFNFEKIALVTDSKWIKKIFEIECALIPTIEGKGFSVVEKYLALDWLKTDQRKKSRMDVTFAEFVETSTLKFASGFGIGLLAAGFFGDKQRRNIGFGVLAGTIFFGLPLGIKVLNNNRQLIK